jgi:hypothetical protein
MYEEISVVYPVFKTWLDLYPSSISWLHLFSLFLRNLLFGLMFCSDISYSADQKASAPADPHSLSCFSNPGRRMITIVVTIITIIGN